jgi:hypothetical protein
MFVSIGMSSCSNTRCGKSLTSEPSSRRCVVIVLSSRVALALPEGQAWRGLLQIEVACGVNALTLEVPALLTTSGGSTGRRRLRPWSEKCAAKSGDAAKTSAG